MMGKPTYLNQDKQLIKAQHSLSWSRDIAGRLLEHFDFINISPSLIVNLGSGPGWGNAELVNRFPNSSLLNVDISWQMLSSLPGHKKSIWQQLTRRNKMFSLCSNAEQVAIQSNSVDVVFCHLLLPVVDGNKVFQEVKRILKPNGLFIFSSFGPDTLKEVPSQIKHQQFLQQLIDMHDVGDALIHHGFQHPVMDRENLSLTFTKHQLLIEDFYTYLGYSQSRLKLLKRSTPWMTELERLSQGVNGEIHITLELNYGHAWKKDLPKTPDGRPVIPIQAST
ncbi:methyltransferase domain-containing protein [Ferrovum sp. PN-J185]|uniref:methyltransferase domain-containing protein n=1 Tax=Ferrovum sp. PN-J185 TaxID=1356306 RepID=UPI001E2CC0A2|nr:methyltransferase domain-containing protein [Ferrovum sp. PN-J185]MCC6068418.1 methyltransferase domain-containing protein [Ferrovum sp. PN-J185]